MSGVKPVPQGLHTVTPNLVLRNCAEAIEFYRRGLGAEEVSRFPAPDGKSIWHAELRLGDCILYVNDEMPGGGPPAPTPRSPAPVGLWVYGPDCDAAFRRAIAAGATATLEPTDMFWGDRLACVADPYGYLWSFATRQKDLTPEEMRAGAEEFARSMR